VPGGGEQLDLVADDVEAAGDLVELGPAVGDVGVEQLGLDRRPLQVAVLDDRAVAVRQGDPAGRGPQTRPGLLDPQQGLADLDGQLVALGPRFFPGGLEGLAGPVQLGVPLAAVEDREGRR
jgi:hypothetical protein